MRENLLFKNVICHHYHDTLFHFCVKKNDELTGVFFFGFLYPISTFAKILTHQAHETLFDSNLQWSFLLYAGC